MQKILMACATMTLAVPVAVTSFPDEASAQRRNARQDARQRNDCRRSAGTTGLIAGGVGGALVGRSVDSRGDRTLGTLLGAGAGALAGRAVDRTVTARRRCR